MTMKDATPTIVRMPTWLHRVALDTAKRRGISLNRLMVGAIMAAVDSETEAAVGDEELAVYDAQFQFVVAAGESADDEAYRLYDAAQRTITALKGRNVTGNVRRLAPMRPRLNPSSEETA